jgi:hypothetical protein
MSDLQMMAAFDQQLAWLTAQVGWPARPLTSVATALRNSYLVGSLHLQVCTCPQTPTYAHIRPHMPTYARNTSAVQRHTRWKLCTCWNVVVLVWYFMPMLRMGSCNCGG